MHSNTPGSILPVMSEFSTIVDLMRYRSNLQPQQGYVFLVDGENQETHLSYKELDQQARAIAAYLQSLGITGQALLLYPPGLEFIAAFLGCLYAGVVAVPAYPPRRNQNLLRVKSIAVDAQVNAVLTTKSLLNLELGIGNISSKDALATELEIRNSIDVKHWIATDSLPQDLAVDWQQRAIDSNTLAFLQYTSGSTGNPKGVMVSHGNLLHNCALIYQKFEHTPESRGVIWLPPYHDMGLIGGVLQPLYGGFPVVLMSPVLFLQKPQRWLQAISHYRATTSGAPNFAYELCVQKIAPEQRTMDLSSWEVAFTGAEPIRAETLERFAAAFAECGFRRKAFYPCYGLAEATLFVSGGAKAVSPKICHVETAALREHRVEFSDRSEQTQAIVSCGIESQEVAIANPETLTRCGENQVGEIWVAGQSLAQGYWNRSDETALVFGVDLADREYPQKKFLRTGDLGFIHAGELYVTGRIKDTIIIRGRNYYPQDIERTVEQSHPVLRLGHGAAFGVEIDKEEKLVVVQEVERTGWRNLAIDAVIESIRATISQQHELQVYSVLLLKPGSIPKTSSGKIQRYACRAGFESGSLNVIGKWQAVENSEDTSGRVEVGSGRVEVGRHKLEVEEWNSQSADKLIQWLRDYADEQINSRVIDERRCIPPYIVLDFGNQGLLGMQVPKEYGGLGLGHYDTMRVLEQLGAIDPTLSLFVGLNNILGIRPILQYGSSLLREELLPLLATGRELAAFALTETGAGSNPQAITSQAIPHPDGGWRLQGSKIWSGSAAWAGVTNVFVQHIDADGMIKGISGFAVRKGTGLRQGQEALTMGMRGMVQNTVYLNDVPVNTEQLLGKPGSGMQVAQDAMMYGRLAIASASVGGMKRCAQLMLRYSSRRSISTGRLLENPFVLHRLSEITAAITAVETLVAQIAQRLDAGEVVPPELYAACKTAAPEFYWQAADSLVQVLGGRGYIETNIAPQILRDARILRIFEGPTETLNLFLGSRVIHEGDSLQTFISQSLKAPEVAQRLEKAAQEIYERYTHPNAPLDNRVSSTRWAAILTGEVATSAILWAALHAAWMHSQSERLQQAIHWIKFHFEQKLTQALLTSQPAILSSQTTADIISNYVEAIGDIEQTLAGEDCELDELLRKSDVAGSEREKRNSENAQPSISKSTLFSNSHKLRSKIHKLRSKSAESIQTWIVDWLSQKLKLPQGAIDRRKSFADYGMDSVIAVELAQDLEEWLGYPQTIEATIAWNFPTIESLSHYFAGLGNSELGRRKSEEGSGKAEVEVEKTEFSISNSEFQTPNSPVDFDSLSEIEIAKLLAAEIAAVKGRASQ
jgi:acyl-CoA synthetase (AMP-forming)/AMP-acid ligase II/alkylation response protein AidB-like acyl-CoA dehydrogenase/acyl carrier protein